MTKPKQRKWSPDDRRRFAEQRLRAQTVPSRRFDGPTAEEWDDHEGEGL